MLPLIAALGASAISGGISALGQSSANKANAAEAQKNRDWQEQMSNTAHQRETADLKAAGLNPMLSGMGGSGASSGGGAQATMGNTLEGAGQSAKDAFSNYLAVGDQQANLDLKKAQTDATVLNAKMNEYSAKQQMNESAERITGIRQDTIAKSMDNAKNTAAFNNSRKAAELNAELLKKNLQTDLKYQGTDQFMKRANEGMGLVGSALGVARPSIRPGGYNESIIHPGTGEVTREREVRYTK